MSFFADLHVHSRFSRATSRDCDLEHLYISAQIKGIRLVGTGDFTHPQWADELRSKLIPDRNGLLRLKPEIERACDEQVPERCRGPVRFMLQTEISNIYKKNEHTRKNHNLVYMPDFESATAFSEQLECIGNIHSDGRPILGLDARNLLEIVLETSDFGFLIPAHIWTPWFSMLGSKSGFDSIDECFDDLTPHIFAVETGLSSDPPMNWRVSNLDGLTLVSNSDAHSPAKLGREANMFQTELSYFDVHHALKTGDPDRFLGTVEFFPEEGKYHLDGHRKCGVRLSPGESLKTNNTCPECGRELTLGVSHRVETLADREMGVRPPGAHPFTNMVTLADILAELFSVGPNTKTVKQRYDTAVHELGSEFTILKDLPLEEIEKAGIPLLGDAVGRIRRGKLHIAGGYDGVFGTIRIFTPEERQHLLGQQKLFHVPAPEHRERSSSPVQSAPATGINTDKPLPANPAFLPNAEQVRAIQFGSGPLIITAGPGTGKTLTLTRRIASLVSESRVPPNNILAITFTNKAADEMRERMSHLIGETGAGRPLVSTFHAFCYRLLNEKDTPPWGLISESDRLALVRTALQMVEDPGRPLSVSAAEAIDYIIQCKQSIFGPEDDLAPVCPPECIDDLTRVYRQYQDLLTLQHLMDYEDLIFRVVHRMETDPDYRSTIRRRYPWVLVDEYQDVNYAQYRLIRAMCPPRSNLCVIGDPDQSIYGFRGADRFYFKKFTDDYPDAETIHLTRNYRSTGTILDAAYQVVQRQNDEQDRVRINAQSEHGRTISIVESASEQQEAVFIGKTIERLIGGTGFQAIDFGTVDGVQGGGNYSFGDMAVLYRTHAQSRTIAEVFSNAGIPYTVVSRRPFFELPEIDHLISLLKITEGLGGISDLVKLRRIIRPGISKESMERMQRWCFENAISPDSLRYSVRQYPVTGLTRKRQRRLYDYLGVLFNIRKDLEGVPVPDKLAYLTTHTRIRHLWPATPQTELACRYLDMLAERHADNAGAFLSALMLQHDADHHEHDAETVSLMTVHAAKGLEFPVVFLAGCEDGLMPYRRPDAPVEDMDEERRLFFVAATRAKYQLVITWSNYRRIYGKKRRQVVSPFAADIESALMQHETAEFRTTPMQQQLDLF